MKTETIGKLAGYVGATIGILGWLIGFGIFCLVTEMMALFYQVFLPGLLLSLIFAGFFVLIIELLIYRFGVRHYAMQIGLWALLTSFMGILWFILNHWLADLINRHPEAVSLLSRIGSVYQTTDRIPVMLMAAGVALLLVLVGIVLGKSHEP